MKYSISFYLRKYKLLRKRTEQLFKKPPNEHKCRYANTVGNNDHILIFI